MELLLILIYVSICYVVFKVFRIPVYQWSLATAALGGIMGIALLLLIMNYNHPFTNNARIYFAVTHRAADGEGPGDRGPSEGERAPQGRGCVDGPSGRDERGGSAPLILLGTSGAPSFPQRSALSFLAPGDERVRDPALSLSGGIF
jgi:hypothetical protein